MQAASLELLQQDIANSVHIYAGGFLFHSHLHFLTQLHTYCLTEDSDKSGIIFSRLWTFDFS